MCPFCHPDIYRHCFLESPLFLAIYNLSPIFPGHCLIIPRRHLASLTDLSTLEQEALIPFTNQVIKRLSIHFPSDGFNLSLQDGVSGGQTIPHLHLHLLPRLTGDLPEPGDWYPLIQQHGQQLLDSRQRQPLQEEEILAIVKRLRLSN